MNLTSIARSSLPRSSLHRKHQYHTQATCSCSFHSRTSMFWNAAHANGQEPSGDSPTSLKISPHVFAVFVRRVSCLPTIVFVKSPSGSERSADPPTHASRNLSVTMHFTVSFFAFDVTFCARVSSRKSRSYRLLSDLTIYILVLCWCLRSYNEDAFDEIAMDFHFRTDDVTARGEQFLPVTSCRSNLSFHLCILALRTRPCTFRLRTQHIHETRQPCPISSRLARQILHQASP